jgi:hypothetical protein
MYVFSVLTYAHESITLMTQSRNTGRQSLTIHPLVLLHISEAMAWHAGRTHLWRLVMQQLKLDAQTHGADSLMQLGAHILHQLAYGVHLLCVSAQCYTTE